MRSRLHKACLLVAIASMLTGATVAWTFDLKVADPLETFVNELVVLSPGKGVFPGSFDFGGGSLPFAIEARTVTLEQAFAIGKHEVPQDLYEAIMQKNPSRWKGSRNSVEMVSRDEAEEFCQKLTQILRQKGLITEIEEIRLPTEEEWEYACRGGTDTPYSFGELATGAGDVDAQARILDAYGWHHGNAAGNDPAVGSLKPNPFGLYDMHGYLWEWTSDRQSKVAGSNGREKPVLRGGSWKNRYPLLQSRSRLPADPDLRDDAVGFRCVKANLQP